MKKARYLLLATACAALAAGVAGAGEDSELVVNGEQALITRAEAPAHVDGLPEVLSGWLFRTDETQALQMDDFENPAMVYVDQAADLYEAVDGEAGKSCSSCHADVADFAGLRTKLPKFNEAAGKIWSMEDYINDCRTERMQAKPWKWSGIEMQSMVSLIGLQSRGMPMDVTIDGPAQSAWELGKEIYYTRYGQLELACSNCHEDNYGNMIRADHLSQGQINGFPAYRLKNTKLNGVHNRFKGCVRDTMAETFPEGSPEFVALELYVASRGNGLSVEGPSVRN